MALAQELPGLGLGECATGEDGSLLLTTAAGSQIALRHVGGVGLVAMAVVGELPQDGHQALLALRAFMGGHLLWLDSRGLTFACPPGSGCIVVQEAYTDEDLSASTLKSMLLRFEGSLGRLRSALCALGNGEGAAGDDDFASYDPATWRMA